MELDDVVRLVDLDLGDDGSRKKGFILLIIIGSVISEAIHWFFQRYTAPGEAARRFVEYHAPSVNPLTRANRALWWRSLAAGRLAGHEGVGVAPRALGAAVSARVARLTPEDVERIARAKGFAG